jgi:hypothetical protein
MNITVSPACRLHRWPIPGNKVSGPNGTYLKKTVYKDPVFPETAEYAAKNTGSWADSGCRLVPADDYFPLGVLSKRHSFPESYSSLLKMRLFLICHRCLGFWNHLSGCQEHGRRSSLVIPVAGGSKPLRDAAEIIRTYLKIKRRYQIAHASLQKISPPRPLSPGGGVDKGSVDLCTPHGSSVS